MRWLYFLLLVDPLRLAVAQSAAPAAPKSLHFDINAMPATRDSFRFRSRGEERGWAVWQYELRTLDTTQQVVYTASSEFRPVEEEHLRVVINRLTGEPISTFHHVDLFSPENDTVMVEHDLDVKGGEIAGRRRVGTKSGEVKIVPVLHAFTRGTILSDYLLFAGAVTNAIPGDSFTVAAYKEFADSLVTLSFVAGAPTTVRVPAGRFDVVPLTSGAFRIFATREAPRRVVKGETLNGLFAFELVHSGPPIPIPE
ncbi:MAG TPA: hypothetical protein VJN39_12945 [Gemmatimonadales bacterium]|nr:hypothetical protein [Gemmatimonadales bacterium]